MSHNCYPKQIFVTGTGTDVGKTIISAILAVGLRAYYWKPIQCGLDGQSDSEIVQKLTGLSGEYFCNESYRLNAALSPHAAASQENCTIDLEEMNLPAKVFQSRLVVEGAGGILVPLNEKEFMLDLIKKLQLPVLLVARSELGTINHTLLSLQTLRLNKLAVWGVVMNGPRNALNKEAIEKYGKVKVLAEIEPIDDLLAMDCKQLFAENFMKGESHY